MCREKNREEVREVDRFEVTEDKRVILNGLEIERCTGFDISVDAGRDPEIRIRVSVDEIEIDGYTVSKERDS